MFNFHLLLLQTNKFGVSLWVFFFTNDEVSKMSAENLWMKNLKIFIETRVLLLMVVQKNTFKYIRRENSFKNCQQRNVAWINRRNVYTQSTYICIDIQKQNVQSQIESFTIAVWLSNIFARIKCVDHNLNRNNPFPCEQPVPPSFGPFEFWAAANFPVWKVCSA